MKTILFVNACVRSEGESRTWRLARKLIERLKGPSDTVIESHIAKDHIAPLYPESLAYRNQCFDGKRFDDPIYRYAHELADADVVVIAAPFWDNSYPAVLKAWIEQVMAQGVTFGYEADGTEYSLCKAQKFWYVSTAGGPVVRNYGYEHVESLMKDYFHIPEGQLIQADNLDIAGYDAETILQRTEELIISETRKDDE